MADDLRSSMAKARTLWNDAKYEESAQAMMSVGTFDAPPQVCLVLAFLCDALQLISLVAQSALPNRRSTTSCWQNLLPKIARTQNGCLLLLKQWTRYVGASTAH